MDLKQKKKRIAHNCSSIGGEVEDTKMADDYVADIMNAMNLTHKSTSIISYQQLEDIRKLKRGDSVKASSNIANEGTDQNMTLPKRLDIKKNHPLMAKCQRNLKILKHNRTIPKPRAHVGAISIAPRPMEKFSSSKKCMQKSDQTQTKVELKRTSSMAESNKAKTKVEPIKARIPKTSEYSSHQSKPSDRKRYKRCRLPESDVSDHNIPDKAMDDRSSESDSGFEKFIKTHHVVNKHKIPTSSNSDSSSDEADYLKPRNPKKKRHSKMRKVSLTTNRNLDTHSQSTHPASQGKCIERTDDGSFASDLEPVDDTHFSSDDSSELPTPAKKSCRLLSKEKSITCVEDPRTEILKPVSTKSHSTSEKIKNSKSGSKKKRSGGTISKTTMKSLPTVCVSKENIVFPNTDSTSTQPFSTHSDVSQKSNTDWVVMGSQETNSVNQDSLKNVNTATSDLGIQIEAVFSLGTSDQSKSHCDIFDPPDSDIEVICDDIPCSNKIAAESVDVVSCTISSSASASKMFSENQACVSKSPKISRKARKKCVSVISNETYPLLKEIKREKDDSMIHSYYHLNTNSACKGNPYSVSEDCITDSTSQGECSNPTTVKIKEEIFHDDDIQILPYRIIPYTEHSVIGGNQHGSKEDSAILNYSNKLNKGTQSNAHSNVFETLKKIDLGLIKEFVQKSTAPLLSVKTEPNDSDVEVVCIESDEETLPVSENKSVGDVTAKVKAKQLATNQMPQQLNEKTDVIAVRDSALLKSSKKARLSQSYEAGVLSGPSAPNNSKSICKNKILKSLKSEGGVSDASDELDSIAASASDELDNIAVSAIKDLGVTKTKNSALLLLELYKKEYERYIEVRSTEQNVSAGLKLLEEKQLEKLKHLVTAIKNVAKNDPYFNKLYKERHPKKISDSKLQMSDSSSPAAACKSEKKGETEITKVSAKKTNFMCVECNKPARAACQGCFKVYYCSRECGEAFWSKGHITACGK